MFIGISTAISAIRRVSESFIRDGLKLYYRFTETFNESQPELLLSGATSFDGSNYINAGADSSLNLSVFTISLWVNFTDGAGAEQAIRKWGSNRGIAIGTSGDVTNKFRFQASNSSSEKYVDSSTTVVANTWYHLTGTADGSNIKLYVNGSLENTVSSTITLDTASDNLYIGGFSSVKLNGKIANFGIWNRALSASEIESIYWRGQYADLKGTELTNLVSWYNLSADANDSTGTNNGTNNGATFLTDAYSASSPFLPRIQDKASDTIANYGEVYGGNAVSFDGTNDFVNIGQPSNLNFDTDADDFTIAMWFKIASGDTGTLICKGGDTSGDRQYHIYYSSSDYIAVNIGGTVVNTNAYDDGNWHHVAVVNFDDSGTQKFRIYIDGSSVGVGNSGSGSNSLDVLLGARRGSDNTNTAFLLSGSTNNVKIFNTALTQDQVRELYTKPELTLPTGVASSALKLDMPMQEGSGTTILDGSGNQNHGTGSGITWANGQEYGFQHPLVRSNNPMVFDGSDDRITNSFDNSAQDATYSFWAKSSKTTANTVFGHGASNKAFHLNFSAGRPILYLAGTYFKYWNDNSAQDDNQWHHYVVVVDVSDANGSKLYIDGSEQTVSAVNNSVPADAYSQGLTIGAQQQSGGVSFDGVINEFAVWHKFLTANEITALYNSGLPLLPTTDSGNYASADDLVGYWRNDGVITWTDRSTNSNNGTVAGDPASIIVPEGLNEGRDSQGYYLTDTDSISSGIRLKGAEHIEVDNSDAFTFGTGDFSYDFWFKWTDAGHKASVVNASGVMFTSHSTNSNNYSRIMSYFGTLFYTIKYGGSNVRTVDSAEGAISSANTWYHIALTVDRSSGGKWYINGSESTLSGETGATETTDLDFTGKLRIGAINYDESSDGSFIGGSIDEFRIYKGKVLSASEVLKNYNNGKSAHSN